MTSTANLPAAGVAAAAAAYIARKHQAAELDGLRTINHAALHDVEALAALALASGDGLIAVSRDDFELIRADFPKAVAAMRNV